ncbi:YycH family regulatory protein [Caldalkalibacillus salinus]|uniref:YycH family regulatory protein n=1 Tax=Caldalkalibacillus salinus TaxID=2803787 RepID=UPI0019207A5F|nr:two-component system activity regulator YycH [Caldalkalibacillus salinus]
MIKERIKTGLLTLLVLLSIFLTWQIWTYQPDYDYLLPPEDVVHQGLADKRELSEVVKPSQLAYHFGENHHAVAYPDMFQYSVIHSQIKHWEFYGFREVEHAQGDQLKNMATRYQGLGLSFATSIPASILSEMIHMNLDNSDMSSIDHVLLYSNPITTEVFALFTSYEEQKMFRANTNISVSELNHYLTLGENLGRYELVTLGPAEDIHPVSYVPLSPINVTEYRYFYQRISPEPMISYLFLDRALVRQMEDRTGDYFYTDGTRGLQIHRDELSMYYLHPVTDTSSLPAPLNSAIQRSIQFVNQHSGWDETYHLYDYQPFPFRAEANVEFRRYIGSFPVLPHDSQDMDLNSIKLEWQQDRIAGYYRSLFTLDRVMEQMDRELPSGVALLTHLREAHHVQREDIQNMFIAYLCDINDQFISYKPYWVVELVDGDTQFYDQIPSSEEVAPDGLE